MDIFIKLLSPLSYLKIKHKQKRFIDFTMPLIFAGLVSVVYLMLPKPFSLFGVNGIILSTSSFLQFLTGFYVASLAAIATFPNKNMDVVTDGIPLLLKGRALSRRQYISYMFGYLAFLGGALVIFEIIVKALYPNIVIWLGLINEQSFLILKVSFILFYFFYIFQLLLITMYALYYLTEKIHESKTEFTGEIGGVNDDKN